MEFEHSLNDTLMRFFDHCAKFVHRVDNNASAVVEVDKFKHGPEMRKVQKNIAQRLGVPHHLITYGYTSKRKCFANDYCKANVVRKLNAVILHYTKTFYLMPYIADFNY